MRELKKENYHPFPSGWSIGNSEKARKDAEVIRKSVRKARSSGISSIAKPIKKETGVVEAVELYFSDPKFSRFSILKRCNIQMGSINSRTDIVLIDAERNFIAIAECKLLAPLNYGPEPLKSYLSATDTPFGIFAPATNRDSWIFYENLRHNRFRQIGQSDFEKAILE